MRSNMKVNKEYLFPVDTVIIFLRRRYTGIHIIMVTQQVMAEKRVY